MPPSRAMVRRATARLYLPLKIKLKLILERLCSIAEEMTFG